MNHIDQEIADFLGSCRHDPLKYVMGAFPWDSDPTIQVIPLAEKYKKRFPGFEYGPDEWQCDFLTNWGEGLKKNNFDGRNAVDPLRFSTVSGHGIGKSALAAMIVKFILDTRPNSVGTVTAMTSSQLRTKTWAEVGKWHFKSITAHWFTYTSSSNTMSLVYKDKELAQTWKCTAQTCDPKNSEAFAGQHAEGSTSFYLFDEASKIDESFFEVREGGLVGGEPMVFDFGNGTRNTGRFYENCVGKYSHMYNVRSIDSRQAHRVNKKKVAEDVREYGEDSDFVRVRWRGMFPNKAGTQFIDSNDVREAQKRVSLIDHKKQPLIIGVDVARYGDDDSVIKPRIGYDMRSFPARRYRGLNSIQVASRVGEYVREFEHLGIECQMVFVDGGGGYGGGVVDQLKEMNIPVTEVIPGRKAINEKSYALRVDEMYGNFREALPFLLLPDDTSEEGKSVFEELTQREYGHTLKGQVRLEAKDLFKSRLGRSPDMADGYVMSFAKPVMMGANSGRSQAAVKRLRPYDPYE